MKLEGEDLDIGGEAWHQLEVGVGCRDDHLIGDNVGGSGGLLANLRDATFELVVGEGIDGKGYALTYLDTADVGFVNVGNDAHIGEVLCDGEEGRRGH